MQTRLWLASAAAVAIVTTGAFVVSPTLHGQTSRAPGADTAPDIDSVSREVDRAVRHALEQAGVLRPGDLAADLTQTIDEATRHALDVVEDIDVDVLVKDALDQFDGVADVAVLGGRPRIGVNARDVTDEEARAAGLSGITGAYVSDVAADSAAAKAGIQANDIIVSIDGETIRSARQLARVVAESPDGRALQVAYVRGTARNTVAVTPEARTPRAMTFERRSGPMKWEGEGPVVRKFERREGPQFFFRQGPGGLQIWSGRGRLGVVTQPLTDQLATYFGVEAGVLVSQVTEGSAAAKGGIKAGDVITAVNGKPVKDAGDLFESLQGIENGTTVPVAIMRDRKAQTITVTVEAPSSTSRERVVTRRQRVTA